jgi:hypothetical protein
VGEQDGDRSPDSRDSFTKAILPLLALIEGLDSQFEVEVTGISFDEATETAEATLRVRLPRGRP